MVNKNFLRLAFASISIIIFSNLSQVQAQIMPPARYEAPKPYPKVFVKDYTNEEVLVCIGSEECEEKTVINLNRVFPNTQIELEDYIVTAIHFYNEEGDVSKLRVVIVDPDTDRIRKIVWSKEE